MLKYVELAVATDSGRKGKEGLYQYRNVCQTSDNYDSLAMVCERFVALSEESTVDAKARAEEKQDALEGAEASSYEAALLAAVTGRSAGKRLAEQTVSPRLKFLWEAVRRK